MLISSYDRCPWVAVRHRGDLGLSSLQFEYRRAGLDEVLRANCMTLADLALKIDAATKNWVCSMNVMAALASRLRSR
jgi:predicted transcriptional regulator